MFVIMLGYIICRTVCIIVYGRRVIAAAGVYCCAMDFFRRGGGWGVGGGGWGRGIDGGCIWLVGESDAHFLCMLTSTCRWMCVENSTGGSSAVRQIKGVGWGLSHDLL